MNFLLPFVAPDHRPLATLPFLPEQCNHCGKNFSSKSSLSKHMLMVHGASRPSKILPYRYLAKMMARRRISFAIFYITFKTSISVKDYMKKGAYLYLHLYIQGPGPARFDGECVREFMFLLYGISVGAKAQERGRVRVRNDKAFKSLPKHNQHKIWQHGGYMCDCTGCGKKFKTNSSINRHKTFVCGKPHHRKSFCFFSMWGKDHH